MEGWVGLRLLKYRLWCRIVGLGGVDVWIVGEKLGYEVGIHGCWFDGVCDGDVDGGVVDGDADGGWSGRVR